MPNTSRRGTPIRVLIADDHEIIRCGLRQILTEAPDIEVPAEASNGVEALKLLRNGHWDVVLMDISMPERNGLDTLKLIKKEYPRLPVIMLSMHQEEYYAVRSLKAGASAYLSKHTAGDTIITAVRTVAGGKRYLSPEVAEQLANAVMDEEANEASLHERLSDREYQTLCLIASGHTLTEIATQMKLSVKTVSVYRSRVLEKMKLRTNAELTYYGLKHGLVACASVQPV